MPRSEIAKHTRSLKITEVEAQKIR